MLGCPATVSFQMRQLPFGLLGFGPFRFAVERLLERLIRNASIDCARVTETAVRLQSRLRPKVVEHADGRSA